MKRCLLQWACIGLLVPLAAACGSDDNEAGNNDPGSGADVSPSPNGDTGISPGDTSGGTIPDSGSTPNSDSGTPTGDMGSNSSNDSGGGGMPDVFVPPPGTNPLEGRGDVKSYGFDGDGAKIDNPVWRPADNRLYFNMGGIHYLELDALGDTSATPQPAAFSDAEPLSLKTIGPQGNLIAVRTPAMTPDGEPNPEYSEEDNNTYIEIVRLNDDGYDVLANSYNGENLPKPNDITISADGHIYYSIRRWDPDTNSKGVGGVVHVTPEGEASMGYRDDSMFQSPNGIFISPDDTTVYVATSAYDDGDNQGLWALTRNDDGTISDATMIAQFPRPDGIAVDVAGNVYVTSATKKKLGVFKPDGEAWGEIDKLGSSLTNTGFGGGDGKTLFISNRDKLSFIELGIAGLRTQ